MAPRQLDREGGYRTNVTVRQMVECPGCGLAAISGANVELDERAPPVPLRRTPLVRGSEPSNLPCPTCAVALQSLRLAWDTRELRIEGCDRCDLVLVDRGELDRIESMLAESAPLQSTDLDRAAHGSVLHEADVVALQPPLLRLLHRLGLG